MQELIDLAARVDVSLSVEFNEHKNYYEKPEDFYETIFSEKEEWAHVDVSKDIWQIRLYPKTPIGFYHLIGNDLGTLVEQAKDALTSIGR